MTALQLMLFGVAMLFAKAGFAARITVAAAADLKEIGLEEEVGGDHVRPRLAQMGDSLAHGELLGDGVAQPFVMGLQIGVRQKFDHRRRVLPWDMVVSVT